MSEHERVSDLKDYKILDTDPEKELDELVQIASAVCGTPIALLTFIDDKRQWFKAAIGTDIHEMPKEDSFCQHSLENPDELLIVNDPLNDLRFKDNALVHGDPHIRFYAGAPLVTQKGNVLGTLCILDNRPRDISDNQKNALMLLAKKVMRHLENRRLLTEQNDKLELSAKQLSKLTNQAPGAVYQLEIAPNGKVTFPFISKGMTDINPSLNLEEVKRNPAAALKAVHPADICMVLRSLYKSYRNLTNWVVEYRVILADGQIAWHQSNAHPEKKEDGTVVWYGIFRNITDKKIYINALEQIIFDISHVIRRPIATIMGLTNIIELSNSKKSRREIIAHFKTATMEMDAYTRKLNDTYLELKSGFKAT